MTLLVVLGVVVIGTILAALYLSLKSGRGDGPGRAETGGRQASGGSRSGRSSSLAERARSMADRGMAAGTSRRRAGGDDDEYDVPDYVTARRSSRRAGGDRSSLVTAGTGHRANGGRPAAGFDDTDPALHAGYDGAGYDGYDAAADTRVSGPMGAEPGTGPYSAGEYDPSAYEAGTGAFAGYGSEPTGGHRGRGRAGERGRAAGSTRGQYAGSAPKGSGSHHPGSAREGTGGSETYPPPDPYSPADRRAAAGDFDGPAARSPRGHARPGGRRSGADPAPSADYDDAPTALTDSPFSSASGRELPADDADEITDSLPGGRRRIGKIQKPQLRIGRSRQDYDNDPWPSADEIDGVSDDQFWSDLSSDKPLATTARTAQAPGGSAQPWAPGDGRGRPGSSARPDSPDIASAPVPADAPPAGRGRRVQRRAPEQGDGAEPRRQFDSGPGRPGEPGGPAGPGGLGGPGVPGGPGGPRRRGEPMRSPRGAEEDPLTSVSFSRHVREAGDSRSYRSSRQAHRPSHERPDASTTETEIMRPDPRGYWATGPAGASGPNAPTGPNAVGGPAERRDPYGDSGYRSGTRPARSYPESTGGYEPPARGSRHAAPPGGGRPPGGAGRPPAASGPRAPRPALPGPASSGPAAGGPSYPAPGYSDPLSPRGNGSSAYPGGNGNGNSPYPGAYRDPAQPGGPGGTGAPGGTGGTGGYPRGRRSSNRDNRPDDPHENPYGGRDDNRY